MTTDDRRLSESVQMYLVAIARLRESKDPVPLSELANELSVSPVSVNEMCRKLQDHGLVIYQPYKGASLTVEGERRALYVLRRHRMWEVFLVERLGLGYAQAHDAACHLEHSTPDSVVDALEVHLDHPTVNPEGEPIPRPDGTIAERQLLPLSELSTGQRAHIVRAELDGSTQAFLRELGLRPGVWLSTLAMGEKGLLVEIEGSAQEISLSTELAASIQVEPESKCPESQRDTQPGSHQST